VDIPPTTRNLVFLTHRRVGVRSARQTGIRDHVVALQTYVLHNWCAYGLAVACGGLFHDPECRGGLGRQATSRRRVGRPAAGGGAAAACTTAVRGRGAEGCQRKKKGGGSEGSLWKYQKSQGPYYKVKFPIDLKT
jgi:hypothetical protein